MDPVFMPWCPFKDCECHSDCSYFVPRAGRCVFAVRTMQIQDLHNLALVLLDRMEPGTAPAPAPDGEGG